MYRRILIPVDEPSEVEPLIRFAALLLEADGEIRVLHVIPTTTLPAVTRLWRESVHLVVPAHETGAALDLKVEPEVRASVDVAGEILEAAETHGIEAILMTLRGSRRSRNPFVGHTSSSVLHHAHADVLIVNRLALVETKTRKILVPTLGGSPPPKAMRIAEELALARPDTSLVTLRLGERSASDSEPDGSVRSPRGLPLRESYFSVSHGLLGRRHRLPELILDRAARERYGLLLVGEDPQSASAPLLTRRFLEELFRNAPCPVIAVRG